MEATVICEYYRVIVTRRPGPCGDETRVNITRVMTAQQLQLLPSCTVSCVRFVNIFTGLQKYYILQSSDIFTEWSVIRDSLCVNVMVITARSRALYS